jgi:hypothetical protein
MLTVKVMISSVKVKLRAVISMESLHMEKMVVEWDLNAGGARFNGISWDI